MEKGMRILLADDDLELTGLLAPYLKSAGYDVTVSADGLDALRAASAEKFDLALIDVMLPGLDGYHLASEISSRQGAGGPAIIIVTSRDLVQEKYLARLSGASDVLQKPFTLEDLDAKLKAALQSAPRGNK